MPLHGTHDVGKKKVVANPPAQPKQLGKDYFTAKPFKNMVKGPVGKGAPIAGKGQG